MAGGEGGDAKVGVHSVILCEDNVHECDRPLERLLEQIQFFGLGMDGDMKCPIRISYPVPVSDTFITYVVYSVFHLYQTQILEEDMLEKVTHLSLANFLGERDVCVIVAGRLENAWQIQLEHLQGKGEVSSIDLRDQELHDDNRLVRVSVNEEIVQIFHRD